MALPRTHRWVLFGKLFLRKQKSAPDQAPAFSFADLENALLRVLGQPGGTRVFQREDRRMWATPVVADDDWLALLIQTGDRTVADPAFVNLVTLAPRDIAKRENEGEHYCSHVLISRQPDQHGRHPILIEKVPGVNLSSIKAHLNWLMAKPTEMKTFDQNGEEQAYRAVVELDGLQSRTLQNAMTTGKVLDVTFVGQQRLEQGHDANALVRERERQMKWTVGRQLNGQQAQSLLKDSFTWLQGWEDEIEEKEFLVRIQSSAGQVKTVSVSAEAEEAEAAAREALEGALVLNEMINEFAEPLTQRHDGLRDDVISKMKERFAALAG